jgi:hypothetical protein
MSFEWSVLIERQRLRPRYREGFGRTPLNLRWQSDLRAPTEGGADGPAQRARPADGPGVVRDDPNQRTVSRTSLRQARADQPSPPAPGDEAGPRLGGKGRRRR